MKHKALKITLITLGSLVGVVALTIATIFGYSATYSIPKQAETIENKTGLVQARNRSLYDESGNKIRLEGVNFGNLFLQEGWMSPLALEPKKNEDGSYVKDKDGNLQYPEFNEEQCREGLYSNPNCGKENYDEWFDYYYHAWIDDSDYQVIKDLDLNCIRIPFYWKNLLNDDLTRKTEDVAFRYLDDIVSKCKEHGLYAVLDLHGAPGSQNGYEHSGEQRYGASLFTNPDYINATVDLWNYVSEHYNGTRSDLSSTIASYDILNEPTEVFEGTTTKVVHEVYDKIYKSIREKEDQHVITFEACWTFDKLPNPKKYGWENVQYEYHWYNFSHDSIPYPLYYAYQDMMNMGRNYNVPVLIGEFTYFEEKDAWKDAFDLFKKRNYSFTVWSYKVTTPGWWTSSWGILTACLNLNVETEEKKCNVATCTFDEFKAMCDKVKSDQCQKATAYEMVKNRNN